MLHELILSKKKWLHQYLLGNQILSVESQKGINSVQCSVENQKGAITIIDFVK